MNTKKQISSFFILVLFCVFTINASTDKKASFKSKVATAQTETSLSFYIPKEIENVYVYVSDDKKNVFQKFKIYQRGEGKIIIDRASLDEGVYYYSMYINGKVIDTQKLIVKN